MTISTLPPDASTDARASVLIVDDNPGNVLAVCAILEPLGQRLITARSGDEALRLTLEHEFAVVLIDVCMPGMDGLETAAQMKAREPSRHVPIIFLTGLMDDSHHAFRAYAHGAVDYLTKPFEPGVLRSKVSVFVELFLRGQQVKRLNAELERRVAERTRELAETNAELTASLAELRRTQEQLVYTGKMAAVGTLVAGLSHELNNPLSIVLTGTQSALRSVPEQSPAHAVLVAVSEAAQKCGRLVRSLLDFTRRTAPDATEPCPAHELVERTVRLAAGAAEQRGVQLVLEPCGEGDDNGRVTVCLAEVEGALLELLRNALDAAAPDGIVRVRVVRRERNGARGVEISVADNGPGIPSNVLPRIFEPFFTTKGAGQGTGLGLSLARHVLERHGGAVRAESAPGAGATFRVWLPVSGGRAADDSEESEGDARARGREMPTRATGVSGTMARVSPPGTIADALLAAAGERRSGERG